MPGLKRTRPRQDSENIEVETATSHLRQRHEGHKRTRLTPVDGVSEDESVGSSTLDDRTPQEVELDSDMSDDEAIRHAELQQKNGAYRENAAAENGIIEEVVCKNFMCHANLTVKLGPLINFVIGHNGSGKSAVLTALQLCLGGKATSTNRGQNLKSFIRSGADQATLAVKIKNQGDNAYQADVYGESIVVERVFSRAGTSGFKLKNQHGRVISTKKSDLEDILDALALQMDNPMNVLTQDMARQFLNSSNSVEKYKFFYQGTHLEQLDSDYRILQESLELNQQQAYNLQASEEDAKAKYHDAEKKAQLAERAASLQEQYAHYSRQMAWVQVETEEKKLASMEEDIRKQDDVIQSHVSEAEEWDAAMESINQQLENAKELLKEVRSEKESKAEEHGRVKENWDQIRAQLKEIQGQQRAIQGEVTTAKKNVEHWNNEIEKEKEKIASADDGRHVQKMENIHAAEVQLTALNNEIKKKSSESGVLDRAKADAEAEVEQTKTAFDNNMLNIRSTEGRIRTFEREKGDWTTAYSPSLGNLLRAIASESRFREKPVGPLGRHVALLKPRWSDILEKQAGVSLKGFAVTSNGDQVVLSELMRRTKYDGPIFVVPSRPINCSQHEPPAEFDTWLRVLKFDNELVRNCMLINQKIEMTVLEEDSDKAASMVSRRIPNVLQIFSPNPVPDGKGNRWGLRFSLGTGGGESQTPIQPWQGGSRMQTDTGTQVSLEREKLARLNGQHRALEESYREAVDQLEKANQAITRHIREIKSLKQQIDRQEVAVQDLKNDLEEDTPQTGVLEEYEKSLKEAQENQEMYKSQFGDSVIEKDRIGEQAKPFRAQLTTLDGELAEINERIKKAEAAVEQATHTKTVEVKKSNDAHERAESAVQWKIQLETARDGQVATVNEFTMQAEQVSRRVFVDDGETTDSLNAKLTKLQKEQARQREQLGGDPEMLALKKIEAKIHHDERLKAFDEHNQITTTLKQALDSRLKRWRKFRDLIVSKAQSTFQYLLSERQFRGKLEIDHDDKMLDIKVQPNATEKSKKGRETKTLSGGEKSFSTICLLLALWEAMGSPIRCLDEFDVFMDQVNRDVSMRMMIGAARRAVSRQFILITPQSMNNVKLGDDVKIHKMSDPERGQTTLSQYVAA